MIQQSKEQFQVIGIKTRTTNADEMNGAGRIGALWEKFVADNIISQIPNAIQPSPIAVYYDYESDSRGAYSVMVGMRVLAGATVPDGLELLKIPEQKYSAFTTRKGEMPGVVIETWQKVWGLEKSGTLQRSYGYDLEIYDERSMNPQSSEVEIWIAVQ